METSIDPESADPEFGDMAYAVRDDVFAGNTFGARYTNLYYEHTQSLSNLLLTNASLLADGAAFITSATPHLLGMLGFSASEPVMSQQFVSELVDFLMAIVSAPGIDPAMQIDILNELWYLSFFSNGFVGKTFNQAWNDLPSIWTYSCAPWQCSPF